MGSKYYLSEADLAASQDQVVGIWALGLEGLIDKVAEAKYRHSYVDNPAGTGTCMLLHDEASDKAIGAQGLIPRNFFAGERRITAATLADFVVAPDHRFLGPALMLMRACIDTSRERYEFVYGTPNDKSVAILRRAGIRPYGALTRYTKLIRSASYLGARLPPRIASPLAAIADTAIACADHARDIYFGGRFQWSEHGSFGSSFQTIWDGRQADVLTGERSPTALNWRYASADSECPWQYSMASDRRGTPIGYVIWRELNGIAMVGDFFCSNIEKSVRALLQSFAVHVRRFAVQKISLEFLGSPQVAAALKACGFEPREQSRIVVVDNATDKENESLVSSSRVFMTGFDRDHDV